MSAEIVETSRTYARVNAEIKPEWLEILAPHLLKYHHRDPYWAERQGRVMALEQVSLFGLVLIEKRRVPFDTVDPAAAREIFLMEALVRGRLKTRHPFLQHNQQLREQLETLEHKRRKPDVLADDRHIAAIFDSLVPPQVISAKSLETWLTQERPGAGQSLMLSAADLMLEEAGEAPAELYPDYLELSGLKFPLTYHFAPGEPDDGISLTVPLELLNRISDARLQWLVPGLLREKMIELARCLPKPVRRALMPGPQLADSALAALPGSSDQSLFKLLSAHFTKQTGMEITEQMLAEAPIPEHLVIRVVLTDDKGQVLAVSRNLEELQARYGSRAQRQFMDKQGGDWNRDDETEWAFGELPQSIETANGASAWPAVVDQQDAVGLRLFDNAEDAAYAHLEGVRTLLSLHVQDKLLYLEKNHGVTKKALLVWTGLGSSLQLIKDLVWSSFYAVADERAVRVRDRDAFDKLCSDIRREIGPEHQARARLLSDVLIKLSRLQEAIQAEDIQARAGVYQDISNQLEDLIYEGFLLDIEASRLAHYSRYLEGALMRLQRLSQDPARDTRLMEDVQVFSQRYFDHLESGGEYTEGLDHFRWLIEEFRISLFAQTLGTAEKTSVKRLQEAWCVVTSGG
jgi:ATP-dependent helicase HrpA